MSLRALFGDTGSSSDQGGLGDLLCLDSDCDYGRNAVREMFGSYQRLGQPAKYATAVAAIVDDAAAQESATHLPFSNYCCAWKAIGQRAEQLTRQMTADAGVAPPPHDPAGDSSSVGGTVVKVAGIAAAAALGWKALSSGRKPRRRTR